MEKPSPNRSNGRAKNGRFLPGNSGGPGNPRAANVERWRAAFGKAVTPAAITQVVAKLVAAALAGERWAVIEVLNRCVGDPATADLERRLSELETVISEKFGGHYEFP